MQQQQHQHHYSDTDEELVNIHNNNNRFPLNLENNSPNSENGMKTQENTSSEDDDDAPPTKIFVGGLSWQTTTESLISYFQSFGEIKEAMVMKDPQTQRSRGFGFVTFEEEETVNDIIRFGKHEIDGKSVDPKIAFPKRGQPKMVTKTKKIFVGGLSSTTVQDDLVAYFGKFGEVDEAMLMFDRQTNRHRGFGFVTFVEEDTVDRVCEIHFHEISGKRVECKKAQPKEVMMPALQRAIKARAVQFTGYLPAIPAMPVQLQNSNFQNIQNVQNIQNGGGINQNGQGGIQQASGGIQQINGIQAIPIQFQQNIGQNQQFIGQNQPPPQQHQQFAYVLPQGMVYQNQQQQQQASGPGQGGNTTHIHTQAYATYPYPLIYNNGAIPVLAQVPQQIPVTTTSENYLSNAAGAPASMIKPVPMTTTAPSSSNNNNNHNNINNNSSMAAIWRE